MDSYILRVPLLADPMLFDGGLLGLDLLLRTRTAMITAISMTIIIPSMASAARNAILSLMSSCVLSFVSYVPSSDSV